MIILSVPGIKRERTVITSQSQKGVCSNSRDLRKLEKNTQNPVTNLVAGAMKHRLMTIFASCFIVILLARSSTSKALTPEDVESLLPPDPQDKNETMAAVVQDPVVQDAVSNAVNNGSLNGLVVKKHVFIMPATDPKKVLSKREHILVVPTENLEDVRKNITEAKQAEAQGETSTAGNQAFFEEYASEFTPKEDENRDERDESSEKRKSGTEFLKNALSHESALPEPEDTSEKKVAVPIIAVVDPTNTDKGKVKSPIVAILPNQPNIDVPVNNQVQFLKYNSDQIRKEAQNFVDGSSLTLNADYWKPTPEIASSPVSSPVYADEIVPSLATEVILTPVVVPQWNLVPLADDQGETGDMDVAEDIIFRPLFRYRQENNRRFGYASNYYPRRSSNYRTRYGDY